MFRLFLTCLLVLTLLFSVMPVTADSPAAQPCDGFVSRLSVNTQARWLLDTGGNLRNAPGRDSSGVAIIPSGSIVFILEGPRCVDGFTWWRVRNNEVEGWLPEGGGGEYWLAPAGNPGMGARPVPNVLSRIAVAIQLDSPTWQGFTPILSRGFCAGRTGIAAYAEDVQVTHVENGSTVTLNPDNIAGSLPVICTNQGVERATAFGPTGGAVNAAVSRSDAVTAVTLPLTALAQGGTWNLSVNNYNITINIPPFNRPQVITQPAYLSPIGEQSLLLGGFTPFQRVALVSMQPIESLPQAFEVETDGSGKWHGPIVNQCLECIQAVVGESGQAIVRHGITISGEALTRDQTENLIYAALWNQGRLSAPECEASFASDLRIAGRAETANNTDNIIRSDPDIFGSTVGYISPNTPVKLLYGPVCEGASIWWLVDYEGTVGWTAERQRDTALLTPFVETVTCPNSWFFTLDVEEPSCPHPVQNSLAAGQDFQGGRAYWYQNSPIPDIGQGIIFVIYNDGTWQAFSDTFNADIHPIRDDSLQPPEGLFQPERGIGLIWRNNPKVREKLGWAYEPEYLFDGRYQFPNVGNPSYVYIDHGAREVVLRLHLENFTWIVAGHYQEREPVG
ncbi:MAG: SH3 domain-containing protein [Chloroflexi bacterium]|nr:SH3 domain-containing protein [Chloroflexota bacterium]